MKYQYPSWEPGRLCVCFICTLTQVVIDFHSFKHVYRLQHQVKLLSLLVLPFLIKSHNILVLLGHLPWQQIDFFIYFEIIFNWMLKKSAQMIQMQRSFAALLRNFAYIIFCCLVWPWVGVSVFSKFSFSPRKWKKYKSFPVTSVSKCFVQRKLKQSRMSSNDILYLTINSYMWENQTMTSGFWICYQRHNVK